MFIAVEFIMTPKIELKCLLTNKMWCNHMQHYLAIKINEVLATCYHMDKL